MRLAALIRYSVFALLLPLCGLPLLVQATAGDLDASFNPGTGADNRVRTIALQTDGKIIIGGGFTEVNGEEHNRIARLNTDGSLDSSFNIGTGVNGFVETSVVQADGKIVIGGQFTTVNGVARGKIARLNADGLLDNSFNPGTGANDSVLSLALQADGKVLIGGWFTSVNGVARNYIARLNADGSLDSSFNPGTGANFIVSTIALQSDGKMLIGGGFTTVNGVARNRIARLNADGSLDSSFNPGTGANNDVDAITVQADGKTLIGGGFTSVNGVVRNFIARLNADGSLDSSFNPGAGANNGVRSIVIQADGKIIIGGLFATVNGVACNRIARLNANGSLDSSFNPGTGANNGVDAITVQADGKIIIVGWFNTVNGVARNRIARINTGDSDGDSIQDGADFDVDGDGVLNVNDVFLFDPAESVDTDNDGIGNNADLDDDNDNIPDYIDADSLNPAINTEAALPLNGIYKGSTIKDRSGDAASLQYHVLNPCPYGFYCPL